MVKKKLIVFDFDGVLINSEINMKFTWKKTMKNFTQYSIDFKEYKKYVGLPFFEILNKLLIKKEDFKKIRDQYQRNSLSYQKM